MGYLLISQKNLRNIKHLLIELKSIYEVNERFIYCDLGEDKCDKFTRCLWYLLNTSYDCGITKYVTFVHSSIHLKYFVFLR